MWWGWARARGRGDEFFTNRFYYLLSNEGEYQKDNIWFLGKSALGSSMVSVLFARAHISPICIPYALLCLKLFLPRSPHPSGQSLDTFVPQ